MKSKHISEHKLSVKNKSNLCILLATGYSPERCSNIFEEEYGIEISPQNIRHNYLNRARWRKVINRYRNFFEKQILKHPLAQKSNRLNILKDAINEAFTWRLDRIHYDKEGNELSRIEKRNVGMIASLVREARAEIEGDKPLVDNSVHHHLYFENIIKKAGLNGHERTFAGNPESRK